jgi:hypothetical protein
MKFFKYKQIARLNFFGGDDLNNGNADSYYATHIKSHYYNNEVNTKRYKFYLDSVLQSVQLSNNARLSLESVYFNNIHPWDAVAGAFGNIANFGPIILRMNNISGNNWDSSNGSNGNTILYSGFNNGNIQINPSPDVLYTFSIPNNFLRNGNIEFEIIYNMNVGIDLNLADHRKILEYLNVSLVIYDVNEEELLLTGTPSVDYGRFGPLINMNNGRN